MIIIPLNTVLLDAMLILNIAVSLGILLHDVHKEPLEFSVFPSVLLIHNAYAYRPERRVNTFDIS